METTEAPRALSDQTKTMIKSTIPVLEEHGLAIVKRMYERLFADHPEIEELFGSAIGVQAPKLTGAILAYADHIDEIHSMESVIGDIAAKHAAAGVVAQHYGIVGTTLLAAMVDVLGELDDAVLQAWAEAYDYLAEIFIGIELQLATAD